MAPWRRYHSANAKPINFQVAFPSTWNGRAMLRLVGVQLSSFSAGSGQLDLLDAGRREKLERLARATDRLRDKFGFSKLQLASSLETHKDPT
jgi:hypothetical protein